MLCFKKLTKILLGVFFIVAISCTLPVQSVYASQENMLYLGGFPAGFILNTQLVEVTATCEVITKNGASCPARDCGIRSGDIIKSVNNIKITSAAELSKIIGEEYATYKIEVERDGETLNFTATAAIDKSSGKKRLGLLVKDSLNGIGTVTYIDKNNNKFGSLGHPVTDTNGNLMQINGGSLYGCTIYDVKKGVRGNPGELKGIFNNSGILGSVNINCKCGIFGNISADLDTSNLKLVKAGNSNDAKIGKAFIYTTLNGTQSGEYEVKIVKIDQTNEENRNYVIKINDQRLLDSSGGIVQGMSGSPIVQDGKLIGAVTHVFVNDPTRGYGISLENMLNSY